MPGGRSLENCVEIALTYGLRTAMYATKTKFSLFDTWYNAANGAFDTTGVDTAGQTDTYAITAVPRP